MRRLVATLILTTGSAIALGTCAAADEAQVDVIFTGVVPPTCALEIPTSPAHESHPTATGAEASSSVQVLCNDPAQIDASAYESTIEDETFWNSSPLQSSSQEEYLTIVAP